MHFRVEVPTGRTVRQVLGLDLGLQQLPLINEGVRYARAGLIVTDLQPTGNQKPLESFENPHEERAIGTLLEDVSRRYGRGSIGLGHAGIRGGPDWSLKLDMLSPRHTTHWDELPLVRTA